MEQQINIVKTQAELDSLKLYLSDKKLLALDTETTGLEKDDHVIGFSICADIEVAYYVILKYWDTTTQQLLDNDFDDIQEIFKILSHKQLIMHNAIFDCYMIQNNFGVSLINSVHTDTMILSHLLNENRSNGLKERSVELFGENSTEEQLVMKESVTKNGGVLTKAKYELYKADADLIAKYGAKDAILTFKVFCHDIEKLLEEGLADFFYNDESMPLLRGPTWDLNTVGLWVNPTKLNDLKASLEADCIEAKEFILKEVHEHIKDTYPGDTKKTEFNIDSSQQISWLLFYKLECEFNTLTDSGKDICEFLNLKIPYTKSAKKVFISETEREKGSPYKNGKIKNPWQYIACDEKALSKYADRFEWVQKLLEYKKNQKMLTTYVEGIESRMRYNIIRPHFLQHGTTSGRYSSNNPNFQNLPRDDKRVKECIQVRPGCVFIGADYSQLEPRIFASLSGDKRLQECFINGEDFYSVIGIQVFGRTECSAYKNDENYFGKLYPEERQISKNFCLAATYGAGPNRLASLTGKSIDESAKTLESYFTKFPLVQQMVTTAHNNVKKDGIVFSLYGRPRRMPEAKKIARLCGEDEPPYEYKYIFNNLLNLAVNHQIQSSGASIMNRAAVAFKKTVGKKANIVLQVHDELVAETHSDNAEEISQILKDCMENTTILPGVKLIAEPKVGHNLAELKE